MFDTPFVWSQNVPNMWYSKSNVNPLSRPYGPMVSWSIGGFGPALLYAQQLEPGAHWNHNLSGSPGHSIHMNKIFSTNSGYPYIYTYIYIYLYFELLYIFSRFIPFLKFTLTRHGYINQPSKTWHATPCTIPLNLACNDMYHPCCLGMFDAGISKYSMLAMPALDQLWA